MHSYIHTKFSFSSWFLLYMEEDDDAAAADDDDLPLLVLREVDNVAGAAALFLRSSATPSPLIELVDRDANE